MTKTAYLIAATNATLGLLVLFGVSLTADQIAGIITALGAWLALASAWHDPRVPFGDRS